MTSFLVPCEEIVQRSGWPIRFVDAVEQTLPPTETELVLLRDLHARTERAHAGKAKSHVGAD